jgi:maltose alpha-D-glucosyltransferase/alpha-amylase
MSTGKKRDNKSVQLGNEPLWYRDAVIYELHVRAFADSNGDGIGDFRGLARKLDYLQDLGVTAIWILPFYPSPLRDDGYDIADYTDVHPDYGTLSDFKLFLREAHARDLHVITELVINHTSDQHPWFQRARRAKAGSRVRDYYVWSKTPDKYQETRVIFRDFESSNWAWDPVANEYYWHRFYSHQPDLNFDNSSVRRSVLQIMDFWLNLGVDGLRLDAIPYLCEREGTNCENLPETHEVLKELRRHVDLNFSDRMLLAEANQWPEEAAAYFGEGDECHMAFHFPVMPRLFMAVRMEDRFPIIDILEQTPAIPETCQWALFLRNHDELTLEMVTDEDRDYMYRVYAEDPRMRVNLGIRRRLAPLLNNLRRKMELMVGLLFSLPGTPVLYYGDEIGMGDNIYLGDRNSVRTPMQWSADRNAGFSRANPQRLYLPVVTDPEYHYEAVNVEVQENNPHSILWWYKRMIALRKTRRALCRGKIEFLQPDNNKILAFIREYEDERILVVANLSRFSQSAELDLSRFRGNVPLEVFGGNEFPAIRRTPYVLTLGPHSFYWLDVRSHVAETAPADGRRKLPRIVVKGRWEDLFAEGSRQVLERILPDYLEGCRWFGGKGRGVQSVSVDDVVPARGSDGTAFIVLLEVAYRDADAESYLLPMAFAGEEGRQAFTEKQSQALIADLVLSDGSTGVVYDALADESFDRFLLDLVGSHRRLRGGRGRVLARRTFLFAKLRGNGKKPLPVRSLGAEQSNSSVVFGDRFIMKVLRRVESGIHPDVEVGRFLTEAVGFEHVPPVAGAVEYVPEGRPPVTIAVVQGFVPNQGDAWSFTRDAVRRYLEEALAAKERLVRLEPPAGTLVDRIDEVPPDVIGELSGGYLDSARLLGQRTGELHLALGCRSDLPDFAPEPLTLLYQRALYQSMRRSVRQSLASLRERERSLTPDARDTARRVLRKEREIMKRIKTMSEQRLGGARIRVHGDYHLGQVLYTGRDFVIIDFEGEPARPVSERRLKRSPLRDVSGMLRSYHYAAFAGALEPWIRSEDRLLVERLAGTWYAWVAAAFLGAYLQTTAGSRLLPKTTGQTSTMLDAFLLEKCLYEVSYELNNRPDWVAIPLRGILSFLGKE